VRHDLVLFDLDGTISDPLVGIERSMNFALARFGHRSLERHEVAVLVGPPLDQAFTRVTGSTSDAEVNGLVEAYRERYADIGFVENVVYPGVGDALERLHAGGLAMAVCTSKRRDFALRILELFGLADLFHFVDGGDVGVEKWQQIEAMRGDGRVTERSLMIGDRAVDIDAARKNGLASGAATWGFGSREELEGARPDSWYEAPGDWLALLGPDVDP